MLKKINISDKSYVIFEKKENFPDMSLIIEGKTYDEAKLIEFEFEHRGNRAIEVSDYFAPITIQFNEDASILTASIERKTDEFIDPLGNNNKTIIHLKPTDLNPKDKFVLNAIINNYKKHTIKGKIKDGFIVINENINKYTRIFLYASMVPLVILSLVGFYSTITRNVDLINIIYVAGLGIIAILLFYAPSLWDENYRKRIRGK